MRLIIRFKDWIYYDAWPYLLMGLLMSLIILSINVATDDTDLKCHLGKTLVIDGDEKTVVNYSVFHDELILSDGTTIKVDIVEKYSIK